ncbi:GGDEF domain-containing protein [Thalassospira sp. ER-Se-21-Dark]|uniref:GGDEF domain-containing protein n=1 Tax=Thalassospira sp. ER-Se-21-Dark TaxID=2585190 RepID=UPI001FF0D29B|nr:GGDEF domain-containing protein [Thalassospira sp. ER-Se-21-Dark]
MSAYGFNHRTAQQHSNAAHKLMAELGVVSHPDNFQLFFTYVAHANFDLCRTIDILRSNHREFDEAQCKELHTRFFSDKRENEIIERISNDLRAQLGSILDTVNKVGVDTRKYKKALDHFCSYVGDKNRNLSNLEQALHTLLGATREMEGVNRSLESRLTNSSSEINRLREDMENLKREAMTDGLTGIANRKAFDMQLRDGMMHAMEDGQPLCLLLLDIDHFKKFNDTYGHQVGDQVIRLMAESLKRNIKGQDTAARYGGEEFAIILPSTSLGNAVLFGNKLRQYIESHKVVTKSGKTIISKATASIGVAEFRPGEPAAKLIERADRALYFAKENGRNQVASEQQIKQSKTAGKRGDLKPPSSRGIAAE